MGFTKILLIKERSVKFIFYFTQYLVNTNVISDYELMIYSLNMNIELVSFVLVF